MCKHAVGVGVAEDRAVKSLVGEFVVEHNWQIEFGPEKWVIFEHLVLEILLVTKVSVSVKRVQVLFGLFVGDGQVGLGQLGVRSEEAVFYERVGDFEGFGFERFELGKVPGGVVAEVGDGALDVEVVVLGELVEGSFCLLLVVELERVGRTFLQIHAEGQEVLVFEVNFMLGIHQIAHKVPHLHHEPLDICDHGAELRLWEQFIGQVVKILE